MRARLVKGLLTALLVLGLLLPGCAALSMLPVSPQDSAARAQALASDIETLRQKADERGEVTVFIKLQGAPVTGIGEDVVIEELKQQAAQSQKSVLEFLKKKGAIVLNTFWLSNAILAEMPVGLLDQFISLTKVERLFENFALTIPEPLEEGGPPGSLETNYTWGLDKIGAPDVWDMGITGSGVRVAVLDTGIDITHADIAGKMCTDDPEDPTYPGGWIEFDGDGNIVMSSQPYDSHYHGTHVSGTVAGGDASGIAIGVAPGASLMHGLVIPGGDGTLAQIIAGMEWAMDPFDQYGNPAGEPADVINMSLGGYGYWDAFIEPIHNIETAGIVLVAAIGNNGEGTSDSPANVYQAFAVGATYYEDLVAGFSSGKVVDWPASHPEPYIKPDFSAPGVIVLSAIPGGEYEYLSGTSMAAPHIAGTVALMLEGNAALTVQSVYAALNGTAVDFGDEGQDTRYGWGRIDAFDAVSLVALDSGIDGFVTDEETEEPLEGARIFISEADQARYSDDSGYYRFFLPPGTYNLTASAFGYYEGGASVEVVEDAFTSQNFALEPMPTGFVTGTVTDAATDEPIEGAIIDLLSTPISTATNGTGQYSIEAPVGTYDVRAEARGYRESTVPDVYIAEDDTVIVDFTLEPFLATVAVLGDYESQLTDLLLSNDIWAEEKGWNVIDDIGDYDVVVVNRPSDPGESTFLEFLEAASSNQTRVIFTSSYPAASTSYGISLLQWYLGDPAGQSYDYWDGDVHYRVTQEHSLLEGWNVDDEITIITGGDCDHAWFWGYSGYIIGDIGSEGYGIRGDAVALGAYGDSVHVLLAGLGPQHDTNVPDWTEDARTIFVRAVTMTVDLVVTSTTLPAGMVGAEYQASLNAIGGTKPYNWAITAGGLPDGLELDGDTGVISGTPTEGGSFSFTIQVTDAAEATATAEVLISIVSWTEFITDPIGDQFYGYGPDIEGADFYRDETTIYFRCRVADSINSTVSVMLLDLDLDVSTGFVSDEPDMPTNDIGADAAALFSPDFYGTTGLLYLWDPYYEYLDYAGGFPLFTEPDYCWFGIPLDILDDDGIMSVVYLVADEWWYTDVAPDEGHGATAQYTLTIHSGAGGSVTEPGEGVFVYEAGTVVDLVATPDEDYRLARWTGDVDDIGRVYSPSTTITMRGNYEITAEFRTGGCFISTAAFSTETAKEIDILREFRDEALLPNSLGARFVALYYEISPPIADLISQHEILRTAVRVGFVDPIVRIWNYSHALWSGQDP